MRRRQQPTAATTSGGAITTDDIQLLLHLVDALQEYHPRIIPTLPSQSEAGLAGSSSSTRSNQRKNNNNNNNNSNGTRGQSSRTRRPERKAAVAAILRFRPSPSTASSSPNQPQMRNGEDVGQFMHRMLEEVDQQQQQQQHRARSDPRESSNINSNSSKILELFFIKRAINPRDPWSGHVAWPGGHVEEGETEQAACEREVFEEVGMDLGDKSKFICIGRLNDFWMISRRKIISCFVFFQLSNEDLAITMQESEVAGYRWVPMRYFDVEAQQQQQQQEEEEELLQDDSMPQLRIRHLRYPMKALFPWMHYFVPAFVKKMLALDNVAFKGILLPEYYYYYNNNRHLRQSEEKQEQEQEQEKQEEVEEEEYMLWGMTLHLTMELCQLSGIALAKHPSLLLPYTYQFESALMNLLVLPLVDRIMRWRDAKALAQRMRRIAKHNNNNNSDNNYGRQSKVVVMLVVILMLGSLIPVLFSFH